MNSCSNLVVALGASAGGLRALEAFFGAMAADSGCSFVVVQHLSPDFRSLMDDLLARHTSMRIRQAEDGVAMEPNQIYLLPAKKLMTVAGGRLRLIDRAADRSGELPINIFLESLARELGPRAVAIILSGTGTDGSDGVRKVREAGGLVIAQDPATAEFDGMPGCAVATGVVDYALAPAAMPRAILEYQRNPSQRLREDDAGADGELEELALGDTAPALRLLKRTFGIDFSHYKLATVQRRMLRRAKLAGKAEFDDYLKALEADPAELDLLYRDMLIGVTEFFRDPPVFELLRATIYEPLLRAPESREVRVWVAGCATGEEAYTHAILLDEAARAVGFQGTFKIFATDVHRGSLEVATAGLYPAERLVLLDPERRQRNFTAERDDLFRISAEIRQRVVFAPHNLLSDPPFTRMDVVSCRNLLIYLAPAAQERVISLLHYALRRGGAMLLGLSEGTGRMVSEFEVLDAKLKLFRKSRESRLPVELRSPLTGRTTLLHTVPAGLGVMSPGALPRGLMHAYDCLLARHLPPGFIVTAEGEIVHFIGDAHRYLEPQKGRASENLLARTSGNLRLLLSTLLQKAGKSQEPAQARELRLELAGSEAEVVDLEVAPLPADRTGVALLHVVIRRREAEPTGAAEQPLTRERVAVDEVNASRIADLEQQLVATRENLQATVEELQSTNEELQAANEEMLAANEELQSTNEELHSVNEELYTVNSEFERKNAELNQMIADLDNLLGATDAGTLFVDAELRIRRYNPAIQTIFRLIPQDIGRSIEHIAYHLDNQEQLVLDTRAVLASGEAREAEVRTREGRWLLRRLLPFRKTNGTIDGVVLTFTRLDLIKDVQRKLDQAMKASRLVWWDWEIPTDRLNTHGPGWCILGYEIERLEPTGSDWLQLTHPEDLPQVRKSLDQCLSGHTADWECEHRFRARDGRWQWVSNKGRVTRRDEGGQPVQMIGTTQDIHERKLAEMEIRKLGSAIEQTASAVLITDGDGWIEFVNSAFERSSGYRRDQVIGKKPSMLKSGQHPKEYYAELWSTITKGKVWRGEIINRRADGSLYRDRVSITPVRIEGDRITHYVSVQEDISAQHATDERRRELERQLAQSQKMETLGTLAGGIAHDFNNLLTGIIGYAQLARASLPEEHEAIAPISNIEKVGYRAANLVRRILAFSRHHPPTQTPLDIGEVVREILPMIRSSLPTSIAFTLTDLAAGAKVMASAADLQQCLVNLCANAGQAIGAGGGAIEIRLAAVEFETMQTFESGPLPAGRYVSVAVADDGPGVPPELAARIFEPFFTTKPTGEGTGLGLSIVHSAILDHHGAVTLRPTPGGGATFEMLLPLFKPLEQTEAPPTVSSNPPVPTTFRATDKLSGRTIWLVDDEAFVADVTAMALRGAGAMVRKFVSARECLDALVAEPDAAQFIVTDQTMPGMTGAELVHAMRAAGLNHPVIIMSGYTKLLDAGFIQAHQPCRYLGKPFELSQLVAAIKNLD